MPAPFDLLRTSQPRGVVGIDRTNPLTQGLRGAWLGGAMPVDAVTRSTSVSSGGITVPSEYGLVADFTGTATTTGPTLATTTGSIVDISGSQITVAIRLRPHAANSRRVCGAHQTATNGWLMALEWPSLNMYCNGTQKTGTSISVNTWTQVAMSFDGASQKHVAKDGAVTTSSQTASFSPSGLPVLIGGYYWAGYAEFDGEIDYLYVWDRGLSPAELQILHSNPYAILAPRRIMVPVSAGGASWPVSLTESASGTDTSTASFVINASISITESASGADTITAANTMARSITENASATDDQSETYSATGNASIVESASATDTLTAAATVVASLVESASAADILTAATIAVRAITESASATDTQSHTYSAAGTVSIIESANATDTITAAATLLRAIVEAGNATDAVDAATTMVRTITEQATAIDTVAGALPGSTWYVSIDELAAAVDLIAGYAAGGLTVSPLGLRLSAGGRIARLSTTARQPRLSTRTR